MRTIDADVLKKDLTRFYDNEVTAKQLIDEQPTIEPERKKGKWVYNSPVTMKCDQCGIVIKDWDWYHFKFCPSCGCDMRGEQE